MVYESDFSRRQFLNSCAESGLFYSSPDYKPQGYLSTLRCPPTSTLSPSPIGSRSERTSKLLASLARTTPSPMGVRPGAPSTYQTRQPFDPEYPYTSSEAGGVASEKDFCNDVTQRRLPRRFSEESRGCCACCHSCGGNRRTSGYAPAEPIQSLDPLGISSLNSQQSMESYLRSRRPNFGQDEETLKPRSPYSVRNVPVRSLDELRETVAIRRNYIKERQQLLNGPTSDGTLALPSSSRRENSASPQPDGSIVTYPSDDIGLADGNSSTAASSRGGSYYAVDE